jgi:hypothetical protein
MPAKCETVVVVPQLSDEENSFLLTAFKHWSKPANFTDDQVTRTKTIFQRIFNDDSVLKGGEFADSLVLQPVNDPTLFYAMVIGDDDGGQLTWKKAYVNATNFQLLNSHLTPFETFLTIVGSYCTADDNDDETPPPFLLHDFFKFWKRKFSPERIARVTRKKTTVVQRNSSSSILRNNDTLKRMRWELRMLGFEEEESGGGGVEQEEECLYFNWVDPAALDKGYAPQSFTVSLTDCDGISSSSSDDEEVLGLSDGVFIDETYNYYYGHSTTTTTTTMHLLKWEHWDDFLLRQMKPVV